MSKATDVQSVVEVDQSTHSPLGLPNPTDDHVVPFHGELLTFTPPACVKSPAVYRALLKVASTLTSAKSPPRMPPRSPRRAVPEAMHE